MAATSHADRLTAFPFALADFRAGFLRAVLRAAVRLAPVTLRFGLRLAAFFFLVGFFLLTTFRAFFATAVTAPPTALPALTAKPFAPLEACLSRVRYHRPRAPHRVLCGCEDAAFFLSHLPLSPNSRLIFAAGADRGKWP